MVIANEENQNAGRPATLTTSDEIAEYVDKLLLQNNLREYRFERRQSKRTPIPCLLQLTPVDPDGLARVDEDVYVVGIDISVGGMRVFHTDPIPYQYMLFSAAESHQDRQLLLKLKWCRFLRRGWYDSGGEFLKVVTRKTT